MKIKTINFADVKMCRKLILATNDDLGKLIKLAKQLNSDLGIFIVIMPDDCQSEKYKLCIKH